MTHATVTWKVCENDDNEEKASIKVGCRDEIFVVCRDVRAVVASDYSKCENGDFIA